MLWFKSQSLENDLGHSCIMMMLMIMMFFIEESNYLELKTNAWCKTHHCRLWFKVASNRNWQPGKQSRRSELAWARRQSLVRDKNRLMLEQVGTRLLMKMTKVNLDTTWACFDQGQPLHRRASPKFAAPSLFSSFTEGVLESYGDSSCSPRTLHSYQDLSSCSEFGEEFCGLFK